MQSMESDHGDVVELSEDFVSAFVSRVQQWNVQSLESD